MATPVIETNVGTNPYVGPRAFQTGEHLFGRSRESAELLDLLIAERIVLLYSPSGAGKSSLINASIIPEMQKERFMIPQRQEDGKMVPVTIRVHLEPEQGAEGLEGFNRYTSSFMRSLEDSFPSEAQCSIETLTGMKLADYLPDYRKRAAEHIPGFDEKGAVLLIIDQLEEMIRINAADRDAKFEFFVQLGNLLRDRTVWALIAIREDYLAAFEPYSRPIPNRLSVTYRLDFLDANVAAIEAIQGPAKESGVTFEDDAARELVKNLRKIRVQQADGNAIEQDGPYVEPVQLQVVCRRLWDKAGDRKAITLKDVADAGNIDDALGEYYAERVAEAAQESGTSERDIREWFDRKLIAMSGIRSQVLMEQGSSAGLANTTIKLLQEAYLVRGDRRGNAIWFELAHDRLTRPVRQNNAAWFGAHLNVFQRQADVWNQQGRPDSLLFKGPAFLEADQWAKAQAQPLPQREQEFLEASRKAHQALLREQRLNMLVRGAAAAMAVLAMAALAFFFRAQAAERTANENARLAQDNARIADDNARLAEQQKQIALLSEQAAKQSSQIAHIRELAAQSLSSLGIDPELSVRLAMQAGQSADLTQPEMEAVAKSVEEALRQALPAMRVEQVMKDPAVSTTETLSHAGAVWATAFDPSGRQVASAGDEGTVKIWDARSGKLLRTISVFTPSIAGRGVTSVAWSPDGKRLAATTGSGNVVIYDASSFAVKDTLAIQKGAVWTAAFIPVNANRPASSRLVIGGEGGLAMILDLEGDTEPVELKGHLGNVTAAAFSPDGSRVATGDENGKILVSDAATGAPVFPAMQQAASVNGLAFRGDGRQLVTSSGSERLIHIWDLADNGREVLTISGHSDAVTQVAFTRDGRDIISVSVDRTIRFWDAEQGRQVMILNGHKDQVFALALSPDGNRIATGGKDRTVRIWNISPEGSRELITFDVGSAVRDIALSPDGKHLLEGGTDSTARVLNATSGQVLFTLTGHTREIEGVAYSMDGKRIITCSQDGTARVWEGASGKLLATFTEHTGAVLDCALSADGKLAATAGQDGTVKVWDPATGKPLHNLEYQGREALAVAFGHSPNPPKGGYADLLAAGYADQNIVLWDPQTGKQLTVLTGHTGRVHALAFRPDGQVLASAAEDGNIILWDMNPERWGQYQPAMRDRGDSVLGLGFSSDGKNLYSGGADGIGTLWDLQDRHADFHTYGDTDRINASEISPDGNFLYSASEDGTIRVYVHSLQELLKLAEKRTSRQFTEEECRQYLNAACPAEGAPAAPVPPPTVGGGPAAPAIKVPPDAFPPADNQMRDEDSSSTAAEAQANGGDLFELGRFERPFNSGEMNIYYPDVDIVSAAMALDRTWANWTITLAGLRGDSLQGNYGVELDLNGDGRGDLLITTLAPGKDWSASGVRIWADKNGDVGNNQPYVRDGPQENGDGYETLVFDQGSADPRDLAWSRIAPNDPNSVQIAMQRSVINNDPQLVWLAWASRDPLKVAWFDYNDHFTFEQAGSPLKNQPQFYPLGELAGVDNTCRRTVGFEPATGQQVFCGQ